MQMSVPHLQAPARTRVRFVPSWLRSDWAAVLGLSLVAVLAMIHQWNGHILWDPDSLFYQAKVIELRTGASSAQALHQVFSSHLTAYMRSLEALQPASQPKLLNEPGWAVFSAQFYARRLLVPAMAALVYPIFGLRSLHIVALVGYVVLGPMLYLLLRRRFGQLPSLIAAGACLLLPTVHSWAAFPLTDVWSLVFEVAALFAAIRVLDGQRWWLLGWVLAVLASSFTHDAGFIPVIATGVVFLLRRERRSFTLVASGFAACLPALAIASVKENVQLATALSQHAIPQHTGWSWVLSHYFPNLGTVLHQYLSYAGSNPMTVLPFVVGLLLLFGLGRGRDVALLLVRAVVVGYLVMLALGPSFSDFRYELVLVPLLAFGFALAIEWALPRIAQLREPGGRPTPARVGDSRA
jgi:Dolichyl-phosphate-mannose-protein mannosyltransferase